MKNTVISALVACMLLPAFAEEYLENPIVVTMTSVRQESRTQDVVVEYTLANHPGIVGIDVLTNGVSIGIENLATLTGDYSPTENDVVQPGVHTIRWRARKDWRGNLATNAVVRLSAYYTNQIDQIPGVYMKVDLNGGQLASSYPVTYTLAGPSTDDAGHATNTDDMDRYLWLRRVGSNGPATYTQGSSTVGSLIDNKKTAQTVRSVTLSKGFFVGVFPVTQAQYVRVIAKNNAEQNGGDYAPVNYVNYNDIRGLKTADDTNVDWPSTGHTVGTNSFLYALRSRTGLEFDLPTEAQWEYACRAGTDTDFNDGSNLSPTNYYVGLTLYTNVQYDMHLAELGWFGGNTEPYGNTKSAQQVGQKNPNAWGLYDCHGNVWEWCLDKYVGISSSDPVTDPVGALTGNRNRSARGGFWGTPAWGCNSSFRQGDLGATTQSFSVGFRLVCPFR